VAKFDVHRLPGGAGYVVDCQANLLSHLQTHFVVPLIPPANGPDLAARLNPLFEVEGEEVAMFTQYAASMRKVDLGPVVASLVEHDIEIGRAIDMLLSGY
jgi:toxin CcdB